MQNPEKKHIGLWRPTRRKTAEIATTESIVDRIRRAVTECKLPPGTKLVEESLGEIFDVSRTKVRQALFQLAKDKLVTLLPGRGAFVAQPSVREAKDIFEARRVVERAIAMSFTRVATREQLDQLRKHVSRERKAVASRDVPSSAKLSGEFHLLIADMAGNAVLADMLHELISRTSLIIVLYESSFPASCSSDDHEELLARIASGNAEAAAQSMVGHLEVIERNLHLKDVVPAAVDLRSALTGA